MWGIGTHARAAAAVAVGLLAVAASGCNRDTDLESNAAVGHSTPAPAISEAAEKPAALADAMPMGGEWRLVAIDHRELSSGGTPVVVFGEEGECWGNTGVNDFRTTFRLGGRSQGSLEFGNAAVTRKAGPPEAMALERLFLERLENARSFEVEGNRLHLQAGDGQHLTLERVLR